MGPEAAQTAVEKFGYTQRKPVRHPSAMRAVPAFAPTPAGLNKPPSNGFGEVNILSTKPVPQKVTIMPNGKRRIQPSLVATLASTEALNQAHYQPAVTMQNTAGAFAAAAEQPLESQSRIDESRLSMLKDVDAATGDLAVLRSRPVGQVRGRILGGQHALDSGPARELRPAFTMPTSGGERGGPILPVPKVHSMVRVAAVDATNVVVTAENDAQGGEYHSKAGGIPYLLPLIPLTHPLSHRTNHAYLPSRWQDSVGRCHWQCSRCYRFIKCLVGGRHRRCDVDCILIEWS
jgi:hypothetical protein